MPRARKRRKLGFSSTSGDTLKANVTTTPVAAAAEEQDNDDGEITILDESIVKTYVTIEDDKSLLKLINGGRPRRSCRAANKSCNSKESSEKKIVPNENPITNSTQDRVFIFLESDDEEQDSQPTTTNLAANKSPATKKKPGAKPKASTAKKSKTKPKTASAKKSFAALTPEEQEALDLETALELSRQLFETETKSSATNSSTSSRKLTRAKRSAAEKASQKLTPGLNKKKKQNQEDLDFQKALELSLQESSQESTKDLTSSISSTTASSTKTPTNSTSTKSSTRRKNSNSSNKSSSKKKRKFVWSSSASEAEDEPDQTLVGPQEPVSDMDTTPTPTVAEPDGISDSGSQPDNAAQPVKDNLQSCDKNNATKLSNNTTTSAVTAASAPAAKTFTATTTLSVLKPKKKLRKKKYDSDSDDDDDEGKDLFASKAKEVFSENQTMKLLAEQEKLRKKSAKGKRKSPDKLKSLADKRDESLFDIDDEDLDPDPFDTPGGANGKSSLKDHLKLIDSTAAATTASTGGDSGSRVSEWVGSLAGAAQDQAKDLLADPALEDEFSTDLTEAKTPSNYGDSNSMSPTVTETFTDTLEAFDTQDSETKSFDTIPEKVLKSEEDEDFVLLVMINLVDYKEVPMKKSAPFSSVEPQIRQVLGLGPDEPLHLALEGFSSATNSSSQGLNSSFGPLAEEKEIDLATDSPASLQMSSCDLVKRISPKPKKNPTTAETNSTKLPKGPKKMSIKLVDWNFRKKGALTIRVPLTSKIFEIIEIYIRERLEGINPLPDITVKFDDEVLEQEAVLSELGVEENDQLDIILNPIPKS